MCSNEKETVSKKNVFTLVYMQCVSVCNLIFAANWLYELSDASTHKQTVQMQILKVPQSCFEFF